MQIHRKGVSAGGLITESYDDAAGTHRKEAERRAWATEHGDRGGMKKSGSCHAHPRGHASACRVDGWADSRQLHIRRKLDPHRQRRRLPTTPQGVPLRPLGQ
jgi:hypothetical protein